VMSHPKPESTMRSQSKGIGSADLSAPMWWTNIRTIPALLHSASHRRDNVSDQRPGKEAHKLRKQLV
jgi:hypothetical protein